VAQKKMEKLDPLIRRAAMFTRMSPSPVRVIELRPDSSVLYPFFFARDHIT